MSLILKKNLVSLCLSGRKKGFSLAEVLMAVGILAVGMIFIAGVFPVAIYYTTVATERTMASVAADEAFAKVKLYDVNSVDPNWITDPNCVDFNDISKTSLPLYEFAYPDANNAADMQKRQYFWSALCRKIDANDVQVTVFVCRKAGISMSYPKPVRVKVSQPTGSIQDELKIENSVDENLINDGYTIVDHKTGQLYRVLERVVDVGKDRLILDRRWQGGDLSAVGGGWVWLILPPAGAGRYPCVAVYQKVMRF